VNGYAVLDGALESLAGAGPDLKNGLTNHAPMVVEALCALDRADAVEPWLDPYREQLLPWPARQRRIEAADSREALGRPERAGDWRDFFADELAEAAWPEVLERWCARLAPAFCASATHGLIRVAHAIRALEQAATPARLRELGDALASWTSTYQTLPTDLASPAAPLPPAEAIAEVPRVPPEARRFAGTITSSLEALADFPPFAGVIAQARLDGDPAARAGELAETMAAVAHANLRDPLTTIVFVHGVTSTVALRSLLPRLAPATAQALLRYGWQTGCALYAAFGDRAPAREPVAPPAETPEALVARAIESRDEHAIKLAEACLREHALRPAPVLLAALRRALGFLGS
jgi:hypothetical protein